MLSSAAPNVVSKEGFRLLLDDGYQAAVVCEVAAEMRHTQWAGRWIVRALGGEGRGDYILVSTRGNLRAREFKTTLGLISFLHEMGFENVCIPLREGTSAIQHGPERSADESPKLSS
jgi:hypothetical protein